jgi:predicted ABC-type ATPase
VGERGFLERMSSPSVVVLGGPNGAGKSTTAHALLRDALSVSEFVNADTIALGLSGFDPAGSAVAAGRILLARVRELAEQRADFAFETTLASRSFAPWLRQLIESGYRVQVVFVWLPTPELAVLRVRQRARAGGHDVPEETIRRRYTRGIRNFLDLYKPLAASWRVYDNSRPSEPSLFARGEGFRAETILDEERWRAFQAAARASDAAPDHHGDDD